MVNPGCSPPRRTASQRLLAHLLLVTNPGWLSDWQQCPDPGSEDDHPHDDGRQHCHEHTTAGVIKCVTDPIIRVAVEGPSQRLD